METIKLKSGEEIPVFQSESFEYLLEGVFENTVDVDTSVGKLKFSSLYFYNNGKLNGGLLKPSQTIILNNNEVKISEISFYETGEVSRFILKENAIINGVKYYSPEEIYLNEKGDMIEKSFFIKNNL